MKKHLILACVAATAALFSACSNETIENANESMAVRFSITNNSLTTRATTSEASGSYTTSFDTNDQITIYSSNLATDMDGVTGTISGNSVTISGETTYYYKDLNTVATFNAFHPATATYSQGKVSFTVTADQNSTFNANEFLVATATGKGADLQPVALQFEHQLSLVVLKLDNLSDATEVTMNSVLPKVDYVFGGSLTTDNSAAPINITMNKKDDTQTYWAMVPAQTFAKGNKLFTVKAGAYTYTYTVTADAGLSTKTNTVHQITLSKKQNQASLEATISNWNGTENWVNGEVEESVEVETPQELVASTATTMDNVSLKESSDQLVTTNTWYTTTNSSWFVNTNNTINATATLVDASDTDPEHGKYVNLTYTCATASAWHNATLLYYIAAAPKKKCTLSFQLKTDNVDSNAGVMVFLGTKNSANNDRFIPCYSGTETVTYSYAKFEGVGNTADKWKDVTINYDLSKLCNTSSTFTLEVQTEETVSLCIGIQARTSGKVYSIDNVKLTTIVE